MFEKLRILMNLETDREKLVRYERVKESYEKVSKEIDNLADIFLFEKSLYDRRIKDNDNANIKDIIDKKWNKFLELHKGEIRKSKKEYNKLQKEIDSIEKSIGNKINLLNNFNKIKKAYKIGAITFHDYNKALNKITKGKTKYSDFLLFNENGELLLLKRSNWEDDHKGAWVIPGGHVDLNETFEDAALRELWEESGLRPNKFENVGSFEDENVHIEYFQGDINTFEQSPLLDIMETRDYKWIPLTEIDDYEMIFNMKDNIKKILNIRTDKINIKKSNNINSNELLVENQINILNEELKGKYLMFFNEIERLQKGYNLLISKSLNDEAYLLNEKIEKAKKDISKLQKIKKVYYRDGKVVLGTFYVKTGEEEIDETKTSTKAGAINEDITIGEFIKITDSKGKELEGDVIGLDFLESAKTMYLGLIDKEDKVIWRSFKSIKSFTKLKKSNLKKEQNDDKLIDIPNDNDLKDIKTLGGSSDVRLKSDAELNFYAVKKPHEGNINQIKQEKIINDLYNKLGFNASISKLDENNGVLISKYISASKELNSVELTDELRKEIQKGFVLDALLGNWDVIGSNMDNILIKNNKIYRIDNGGCLETRAMGGEKEYDGNSVPELETLKQYYPGKLIFESITDEEINRQIKDLFDKKDLIENEIKELPEILQKKILSRLDFLYKERLNNIKEPEKSTLRKNMPSLVTQKYFDEKWSKVDLPGGEEIKEHIKNHIIKIENLNKDAYIKVATVNKMTVDELKEDMQRKVEAIISRSKGYIVAHSGVFSTKNSVKSILTEGRFKTQFEAGYSHGRLSFTTREETENGLFGYKDNLSVNLRPVYGFFTDKNHGVINRKGTIPPPREVSQYGDICFEVKDEKFRKDSTITFRDSLSEYDSLAATPVSAPHFTSIHPSNYKTLTVLYNNGVSHGDSGFNYVETQYHGQLNIDDIEKIHISTDEYKNKSDLSRILNDINEVTLKNGKLTPIEIF